MPANKSIWPGKHRRRKFRPRRSPLIKRSISRKKGAFITGGWNGSSSRPGGVYCTSQTVTFSSGKVKGRSGPAEGWDLERVLRFVCVCVLCPWETIGFKGGLGYLYARYDMIEKNAFIWYVWRKEFYLRFISNMIMNRWDYFLIFE